MVFGFLIVQMCYVFDLVFKDARYLHRMARAKGNVLLFLCFHFLVASSVECYCIQVHASKPLQLFLNFNLHSCYSAPHGIKKEQLRLTAEQVMATYCRFLRAYTYLLSVKCADNSDLKRHFVEIIFSSLT